MDLNSSVRFRLQPDTSNSHEFELHRPSNKGTKLLLKVIQAIIIILPSSYRDYTLATAATACLNTCSSLAGPRRWCSKMLLLPKASNLLLCRKCSQMLPPTQACTLSSFADATVSIFHAAFHLLLTCWCWQIPLLAQALHKLRTCWFSQVLLPW